MKNVHIFTEGGSVYGYGHISRCCALYDEFERRGYVCTFYIAGDFNSLKDYLCKSIEWRNLNALTKLNISNEIIVADSYHANEDIYGYMAQESSYTLFIDDEMRINYPAPCTVLNGSLFAENIPYPSFKDVKYLLGTSFTLLRSAFQSYNVSDYKRKGVLITMGGSDVANITPLLLNTLQRKIPDLCWLFRDLP